MLARCSTRYIGFGFSGEYQGDTESTRPKSYKISKKSYDLTLLYSFTAAFIFLTLYYYFANLVYRYDFIKCHFVGPLRINCLSIFDDHAAAPY